MPKKGNKSGATGSKAVAIPPKKSKAKGRGKKQPRQANALRKGRVAATSVFGSGKNYSSTSGEVPSAFVNIDSNAAFCESAGAVVHPYTGVEGVCFVGCQPFTTIGMNNTASDMGAFTASTLATVVADSSAQPATVLLSPDDLNGRLAAVANLYSQFVFRDIVIEYVSNCATTQADSFVLAYNRDPYEAQFASPTFSSARQITPSLTIPFRTDRAYFHVHYPGNEVFYQLRDLASLAGERLTHQGAILGYADKAQGNVASLGYTNIWYVVELYNPVPTQGITMSVSAVERARLNTWRAEAAFARATTTADGSDVRPAFRDSPLGVAPEEGGGRQPPGPDRTNSGVPAGPQSRRAEAEAVLARARAQLAALTC